MKNIIAFVILFSLAIRSVFSMAESVPVSEMTIDQLYRELAEVDARIKATEQGDVVLDDNGLLISWYGVEREEDKYDGGFEYQVNFLRSNNTGKTIVFDMPVIAINGYVITKSNDMSQELMDGMNVFTAATNICFFDDGILGDSQIEEIKTVRVNLRIRDVEKNELYSIDYSAAIDSFEE